MASTYLTRTVSSTGSKQKATLSQWVKRSGSGINNFYGFYESGTSNFRFRFDSSDRIDIENYKSSSTVLRFITNRVFRDFSAWYNIVVKIDTTQATEANRFKLYINGVQETSFNTETYPSQNLNLTMNEDGHTQQVGSMNGTNPFNGSMSHVNYSDGYAYDASTFGSTDSTTGEWKINTSPSMTMGTNGFTILKDGNTITDQSSNSNNFSLGAGTLTKTEDCPSNVFATLNPLAGNCTFSNGNNTWVGTSSGYEHSSATLGASLGKYYWEVKPNGACGAMGITDPTWQFNRRGSIVYASSSQAYIYEGNGYVSHDSYGDIANNYSNYGSSDIIGIALDLDNNKLYFSKNGTYENSGVPTSGSTGTGAISIQAPSTLFTGFYTPLVADLCGSSTGGGDCNFGNGYFGTTAVASAGTNASGIGIFEYDVPTGYTALSTKGLNL